MYMKWCSVALPESGSRCVVGMSGGVDSGLVTKLLLEKGCHVIGVTMSTWANDMPLPPSEKGIKESCYGPDETIDIAQCKAFCNDLGIEHYTINVSDAYHREVLEYFKREYRQGKTPNPCVRCNPTVKFGALLDGVKALGIEFDYFCTGHYADLVRPEKDIRELYGISPYSGAVNRPVMIRTAADSTKDQTYFLNRLSSEILEKVRFPLSSYTKKQVFEMASERALAAATRSESQDFIPETYFDVIFSDKESVPGDIVDLSGKKLGVHRGIEHYTIGQRRGLGVSSNKPLYVHSIDAEKNQVVLSDNDALLCAGLVAEDWVWAGNYWPEKSFDGRVKIRLASPATEAEIIPQGDGCYKIMFKYPQRAVAPGQSAVVYLDGVIVGGGVISQSIRI